MTQRISRGNGRARRVVGHAGSRRLRQVTYIESGNAGQVAPTLHKAGAIVRIVLSDGARVLQRAFVIMEIGSREEGPATVKNSFAAGQPDDVAVEIGGIKIVIRVLAALRCYGIRGVPPDVPLQTATAAATPAKASLVYMRASLISVCV